MTPKWRQLLLVILILVLCIFVIPLMKIPSNHYSLLFHYLFNVFLGGIWKILSLIIILLGLFGLLLTYKNLQSLKSQWRFLAKLVLVLVIGVCIFHLRKITTTDYISAISGILGMFLWIVVLPLLVLASLIGFIVSFICLSALITQGLFPKINVSSIIKSPDQNPTAYYKWKRFFLFFTLISWSFMLFSTFLYAWYQSFEIAIFLLPFTFLILLFALEISFILGIVKWNTLKASGINLVLLSVIIGIVSIFYINGVMKENQFIYNKLVDLRFRHDYPVLIHSLKLDTRNNSKIKPTSDILSRATIRSGITEMKVNYIKIITGARGMGGTTSYVGYIYIADDQLIGIPEILNARKIIPCWYRVLVDF